MKKIYSFVLMAAMLLIGANAWAGTYEVTTTAQFENAWAQSANEDVVINLNSNAVELQKVMWLGTTSLNGPSHSVVINLNGKELTISGSSYGFLLTHGSLTINGNGSINASCGKELFFVTGSNEHATDYTTLKIGQGVEIDFTGGAYVAAISVDAVRTSDAAIYGVQSGYMPSKGQLGYNTSIYTNPVKGAAMGVKVEVDGTINARRYAVKTNGDLGYAAADKNYAPYIHIQSNAIISVLPIAPGTETKQPIALYASGYANWEIEGKVTGNVGVLVKSGDVDIEGATIQSTNTQGHVGANNSNSGSTAQGSAIVISSEDAYVGQMDVTVSGEAKITAGKGYALEESVPGTNGTKVDVVTVEGGSFIAPNGSTGAVIISQETATAAVNSDETTVAIISAVVTGSITIENDTDPSTPEITLDKFTTTSAVIPATNNTQIIVPLDVKLTNDGFASFSAPVNLYKAVDKGGYQAFGIYTGVFANNVLELTEVNFVKAGQGVILYKDPTTNVGTDPIHCYFTTSTDNSVDNYGTNDLKPSTAWAQQTNKDHIYCLRNINGETLFHQYVGTSMPDNKAYLDMQSQPGYAPQRIRMVIAQEEQTEAVERVEAASVKAVKFVENGEILIRRGENVYNLQGQIVK